MAHLATIASTIRIGSGDVMLPHYSLYKVPENFKVLEALFPGRIGAGVGRAPAEVPRAIELESGRSYAVVDNLRYS